MKLIAIDVHAHLHTTKADAALSEASNAFGTLGQPRSAPEALVEYYRCRSIDAVIFDIGKERIGNSAIAEVTWNSDGLIFGFTTETTSIGTDSAGGQGLKLKTAG